MNMTDEELDRDWKPNGRRPQSTIARSFSQELMDIFRIENSVTELGEQVDKRKQELNSKTTELEAIEARIREMEKRLKKPGDISTTSTSGNREPLSPRSQQRPSVATVFGNAAAAAPPLPEKDQKHGSRPGTARQQNQQAVPGALPPTPVASEGEYELVHNPDPTQSQSQSRILSSSTIHRRFPQTQPQQQEQTQTQIQEAQLLRPSPSGAADDARSVKSERSFADYVVVPAPKDGDGEQDA